MEEQGEYGVKIIDKRIPIEEETRVVPHSDNAFLTLFQIAAQKGYDPEFISKMMALQERHEANEARKAYHKAMAAFKANPPKIWRDLQVKYQVTGKPETQWSHADLGTAADAISVELGKHGLNSTWRTEPQDGGKIKVRCVLSHELGHHEETWLLSELDKTGGKNDIQALGSSIFYLERYTLFAITGLAPARMDDDGKGAEVKFISTDQQTEINDKIKELNMKTEKFFGYMSKALKTEITSVESIPERGYAIAMAAIKAQEIAIAKKGGAK